MTTTKDTTPTIAELAEQVALLTAAVAKVSTSASNAWTAILAIEEQMKVVAAPRVTDQAGYVPNKQTRLLMDELVDWRLKTFHATGVKAHHILTNASVAAIAANLPADRYDLAAIPGVGVKTVELYGDVILDIVVKHARDIQAAAEAGESW